MDISSLSQIAFLTLDGFVAAMAALLLWSLVASVPRRRWARAAQTEIVFLFEGGRVVDASDSGYLMLQVATGPGTDMQRLLRLLARWFAGLPAFIAAGGRPFDLVSDDGLARLVMTDTGPTARLVLADVAAAAPGQPDRFSHTVLLEELSTLRGHQAQSPVPAWRQSPGGRVVWANAAYRRLAGRVDVAATGPGSQNAVFDLPDHAMMAAGATPRLRLTSPDTGPDLWFDCQATRIDADILVTAVPADGAVRAEQTLRDFIQTLTQTFAHLSIGLAVFDRHRELTLFNPALTDLMALPADFLAHRPKLTEFLDQLRERRMIPEPRNYRSWRQKMSELESAAADGSYLETWVLADGRTFRVTGRPHPDGAVAFLFEDISAEISLTRKYRAELELGQAVIDSLDEAIAVFSPAGVLTMSNRSYAGLWGDDPSTSLADISFIDATRRWQRGSAPTPVWGDARDFALTIGERSDWTADVLMNDGRTLWCRFETLPGGATLVGFTRADGAPVPPVASDRAAVPA